MKKCECGCGRLANKRFVLGHHMRLPGAKIAAGKRFAEYNKSPQGEITTRLARIKAHEALVTHGLSKSRAFSIWANMIQRCTNKNIPSYKYYGARGITICRRWLTFINFYQDMGDPPYKLTLDRKNNDGPYAPSNCRWATLKKQRQNRRPVEKGYRHATIAACCVHGHPFSGDNLYISPDGKRRCKICGRRRCREYYLGKRKK